MQTDGALLSLGRSLGDEAFGVPRCLLLATCDGLHDSLPGRHVFTEFSDSQVWVDCGDTAACDALRCSSESC